MHRSRLGRLLAAILAAVMAASITVTASAVEIPTDRPDLAVIAGLYVNWDGSYELPDLGELSEEEQEIVKAMVDAAMQAKEAETQAETADENSVPIDPSTAAETAETTVNAEMPLVVSFSDVPTSHTFYSGITYCASKGIVGGYPDGTFRPANTVTKNHFCAMLARAFYPDTITKYDADQYKKNCGTFGPSNYALAHHDILASTSFQWQYNTASVMGTGINRYDMAQLMTNIMQAKGFAASSSQKSAVQSKITDYKNIPSQYQDAVKNVYALGVIGGYGDGRFVGTNIMNRGQAAIVIQRMAQYAPVKGDQDNDTYDDGTEQNPKPSTGNTGNTGSTNTGSNTGSTGNTGNTGTTTPKPEPKPETPAVRTLSNGKAITESNVAEILSQLKTKYPHKTDFSKGYGGLGSGRSPSKNCIAQVTNKYGFTTSHSQSVSTTAGCGGWAAFVADEIFGQTGVTWKKTTIANARPGDLMIDLDDAGYLVHVSIYVGESTRGFAKTMEVYDTDACRNSSGIYKIGWGNNNAPGTASVDIYTAYPD